MRRLLMLAGACGLLAASAVPALAKPPARTAVQSFGAANVADPCTTHPSGPALGRVQANKRGKSGGGRYHVQVKLTGGVGVEASNDYDVLLYVAGVDPVTLLATCTPTDVGHLQTNPQGKGVLNFKYNADAASVQAAIVLRDAQFQGGGAATADLGTSLLTFTKP
jgi:hypothetical protein